MGGAALSQQVRAGLDVWLARPAGGALPDGAQDRDDLLYLRRRARPHLARDRATTAGVVGKLFGTRYLGTLFGLTLLSHQIGGFLGARLGGIAIIQTGDCNWMWYADMALAAAAALCNLPIREAQVRPAIQPA